MSAKCDICGKGPLFGHNVSFSKRATNRQWKPNLQKVTIRVDGQKRVMMLCTRCLRSLYKAK